MADFFRNPHYLLFIFLVFFTNFLHAAEFTLADVREIQYDNAPAISLQFTSPLPEDIDLRQYFSVSPQLEEGALWISQQGNRQWILPFVKAGTHYQIDQSHPLTSSTGDTQKFVSDYRGEKINQWHIETKARPASARFSSTGVFFAGEIGDGLPVKLINQPQIDLDLFRIKDDKAAPFLAQLALQGQVRGYQLETLRSYGKLVHTARYENPAQPDQEQEFNVQISDLVQANEANHGLYVAILRQPGQYAAAMDMTYFTVTNLGVHVRRYKDQLRIHVHNIENARPLPNTEVSLYWLPNYPAPARQTSLLTNQNGIADWQESDRQPDVVLVRHKKQLAFVKLQHTHALDLSDFTNVRERHNAFQTFFFGPRTLYRPGEHVQVNLLLRDQDARALSAQIPLQAALYDGHGKRLDQFVLNAEHSGTYQFSYAIPNNGATGQWRLAVGLTPEQVLGEYRFNVQAFQPERIALTVPESVQPQTIDFHDGIHKLPVSAQYLYGEPASQLRVDALISAQYEPHPFRKWDDYYFGAPDQNATSQSMVTDSLHLDNEGTGQLILRDTWQTTQTPLRLSASARIYDTGGQTVTRQWQGIRLPQVQSIAGIQPKFEQQPAYNQPVNFQLISTDSAGIPVADTLTVKLIHLEREYFYEYSASRGWQSRFESQPVVEDVQNIDFDGGRPVEVQLPIRWGDYRVEVTSLSGVRSEYNFQTQWYGNRPQGNGQKPEFIDIQLDKPHYAPGDLAVIQFNTPTDGSALLTFASSDDALLSRSIKVHSGENRLTQSIPADWDRHDIYLTIMQINPTSVKGNPLPRRSLGVIPFPLLRENAIADVQLLVPERSESTQAVTAKVHVTNQQALGKQPLFATFALVDVGILNITAEQMPRAEEQLYAQKRNETLLFDNYNRFINNHGLPQLKQRFGGDAPKALQRGGNMPDAHTQIISFFSSPIALTNGQAEVSFNLPTYNGRLRWMAWVHGEESYGSDSAETLIADRVITHLSKPLFLSRGDQSKWFLELHNPGENPLSLTAEMNVSDNITAEKLIHQVTLNTGEKLTLPVSVEALQSGQSQLDLKLSDASGWSFSRRWSLDIREPWPARSYTQMQQIFSGESWVPSIPTQHLNTATLRSTLSLDPRLPINFSAEFMKLTGYPYSCVEQTVSRTYPWLLLTPELAQRWDLKQQFKLRGQTYDESLQHKRVQEGLNQLYSKQLPNGGFGYWQAQAPESKWGTIYAAELMVDSLKRGFQINTVALNNAIKRLESYLQGLPTASSQSTNIAQQLNVRAYAAYVLAKAGNVRLSDIRRLFALFKNEKDHVLSPLPLIHLFAAFEKSGDYKNAQEAIEWAVETKRQPVFLNDYGSEIRDAALGQAILFEQDRETASFTDKLLDLLQHKKYLSTQEQSALTRLTASAMGDSLDWQATITVHGEETDIHQEPPYTVYAQGDGVNALQKVTVTGDQPLFANFQYQGVPMTSPEVESEGLEIQRNYFQLNGKSTKLDQLKTGDLLLVRLTVQLKDRLTSVPDAIVVDLLPAGLQLENDSLGQAAIPAEQIHIEGTTLAEKRKSFPPIYTSLLDDRYVAAIEVTSEQPFELYYLVRAVNPGRYQIPNAMVESMYQPEIHAIGAAQGSMVIEDHP